MTWKCCFYIPFKYIRLKLSCKWKHSSRFSNCLDRACGMKTLFKRVIFKGRPERGRRESPWLWEMKKNGNLPWLCIRANWRLINVRWITCFFFCRLKMHRYWLRSYCIMRVLSSVADLFFHIQLSIMWRISLHQFPRKDFIYKWYLEDM